MESYIVFYFNENSKFYKMTNSLRSRWSSCFSSYVERWFNLSGSHSWPQSVRYIRVPWPFCFRLFHTDNSQLHFLVIQGTSFSLQKLKTIINGGRRECKCSAFLSWLFTHPNYQQTPRRLLFVRRGPLSNLPPSRRRHWLSE